MTRVHFHRILAGFCFGLLVLGLRAQVVNYTWLSEGNADFTNPANWQGGQVPLNSVDSRWNFPVANGAEVVALPGGSLNLDSLYFNASYPGINYQFTAAAPTTLTISPDGGSYGQTSTNSGNSRHLVFDANITLNFATDQYWTASSITFNGAAGGEGRFRYLPHSYYSTYYFNTGNLTLNGPGNFTGGLETSNVNLNLNHASAVAGGPLILTDTRITAAPGYVLDNTMVVSGQFGTNNALTLTGPVTLGGHTNLSGNFTVTGNIDESGPGTEFRVDSGTVWLSGTNTYTGGTVVGSTVYSYPDEYHIPATVIFENPGAVPDTGTISSNSVSYVGITFTTGVQAGFIDHLQSEGFQGTIGFDSPGATQTFTENINLGSFYGLLGLGSSTSAILTGTITTSDEGTDSYRFGGGGGTLTVASDLTQPVGLEVVTLGHATPTTVILQGNNTFTGDGVWVASGIVIFDGANALPSGMTVFVDQHEVSLNFGYAGITENAGLTPGAFLAQLELIAVQAVLGLDSANPNAPRTISDNIDLTPGLAGRDNLPFFVGTATGVTLTGTLTSGPAVLGLTGLKGGLLTVNSVLTDANIPGLVVGLAGALEGVTGAVRLNGANTFGGGTLWQSGDLILGNAAALGTGKLTIDHDSDGSVLDYTADITVANDIHFGSSYVVVLGTASSLANLTLTGAITSGYYYGGTFDYQGGGILTYAGTSPEMGWLDINAAPGGGVVYARPDAVAAGTNLISGSLTIAANTDIKYLVTEVGTTTQVEAGATLGLVYNEYSEGPAAHLVAGDITGAGGVRVESNAAGLLGTNTYTGGTVLDGGAIGFNQSGALGTGAITVTSSGGSLTVLAEDLALGNAIILEGELDVGGSNYFGYNSYPDGANRNLTLSGVISGSGSLYKGDGNTLTLTGDNTFAGGVMLNGGTVVFAHDHAAGTGLIDFDYYYGGTARFTTAAPLIGGLQSASDNVSVELAANSTLTINQEQDSIYGGIITGAGAQLNKTGPGYLTLTGSQVYTAYTGGTTITGGGIIFDNDSLLGNHAAGSIAVGSFAHAGLGGTTATGFTDFLARINLTSTGSIGVDGYRTVSTPIDLSGFLPGLRLGSASFGVLDSTAEITPSGDYHFGGGGGTLEVRSTLSDFNRGLHVNSPADQPLTLWLRNNNYFGGTMSVTDSAVIFGPHSADYLTGIVIGLGGYVGSADPQLLPADFLAKIAPGTNTGMVGFDSFNYAGRTVGGPVDLSAFGAGIFLGTATTATLRGPITLPGGSTTYRFGAYKGGTLTVATDLLGANSVVIGDLTSFGTMRDPHNVSSFSSVLLAGLNTYSGGTVLNAGALRVGRQGLGSGTLTVQANIFPNPTEYSFYSLPRFEAIEADSSYANNIILNGSLWVGGGTRTELSGVISGAGGLYVQRYDYLPLVLTGANTYTGGTTLGSGNVAVGHDTALGSGTITVQNGGLVTHGGARTLANPFLVTDEEDYSQPYLRLGGKYDLTLNGSITFSPASTSYIGDLSSSSFPRIPLLRINGGISGDTEVVFQTGGRVWLSGTNTYTGGTQVSSGELIFNSVASIPAIGQLTSYSSYIGLATPTANLQAGYINRFSSGYGRSIGFDSPNPAAPQTFAANINLAGWDHPYLSSATAAILTGTITPSDNYYRFAATGGGVLTVASNLTGARGVVVDYYNAPFLLRLAGTNTYTGGTLVGGAGVIFATAASLPAGAQNLDVNSSTSSYYGYEDPAISVANFLSHFHPDESHAVIGFDSADLNAPRTITSPDLSYFTQNPTDVYISTATRAIIDGTITWPAFNYGANFAAYRTGWLTVNAVLAGAGPVRIGSATQGWSMREIKGSFPTVELAGNNTYTGNTEFYGGQLAVSHANALGTGTLTVHGPGYDEARVHRLLLNTPTVANNIVGGANSSNLRLATTQSVATLSGVISGTTGLTKEGPNTISLTGANIFSGAVTITGGVLEFAHASASGDMANSLRFAEAGGLARFTTGTPRLGRLESDDLASATVEIGAGVNLTVGVHDQGGYEYFDYYGTLTGAGSLTKDGNATFTLHGASSYAGGTTITQGKLVADNTAALGTGAITLNGGELALGHGVTVNNPISFGGAGGKLSGATTFTGAVTLGAQSGLSPGNSPGTMTFGSDLTMGSSSFLDFEIQDPTGLAGTGYDTLVVGGTLFVTATPSTPFVINLLSLDGMSNGGQLELSNPDATYSLLVVSAGAISGFAPENFSLNTAGFTTNFGNDFEFTLFQSGNELRLNFTAVPEPSTYALLGLGGLLLGLRRWRTRASRRE